VITVLRERIKTVSAAGVAPVLEGVQEGPLEAVADAMEAAAGIARAADPRGARVTEVDTVVDSPSEWKKDRPGLKQPGCWRA
jgi:hypothetical protein